MSLFRIYLDVYQSKKAITCCPFVAYLCSINIDSFVLSRCKYPFAAHQKRKRKKEYPFAEVSSLNDTAPVIYIFLKSGKVTFNMIGKVTCCCKCF